MNRRMEAGPQLDAVVEARFLGASEAPGWLAERPAYSTDIALAFRLLECDRWPVGWVLRRLDTPPLWQVLDLEAGGQPVVDAHTAPLAICRAALLALRRAESRQAGVVHEPISGEELPADVARIFRSVPSCYAIQRWLRAGGRSWWRGSFGPAAILGAIAEQLRHSGFPHADFVSARTRTDLWLRPCAPEEDARPPVD